MSADRWGSVCPKCGECSLREDFEIFIRDGKFHVFYSGSCIKQGTVRERSECGFEFCYRDDHIEVLK